ncbi:hypothetical protein MTQ01_21875 [Streptomyces sp. XM4193]|uniref:SMP-30/gluconolactonase/LRE family protein n=1 Tax=Streptomyces sp. XM4193 TaxID=2929782 RepID=UPI001FFC21C5|nr:hypothetical protein [Streptomyces sp. XM4193]MCK1798626.1 hypothetical protein [Streptomyces sp. XM4193]
MRIRSVVMAATLLVAGAVGAPAGASARDGGTGAHAARGACAEPVKVEVFRKGGVPVLDWRENLDFDRRGLMWVSHTTRGVVEGHTPDGTVRKSVKIASPGGIRVGPDGLMYVNSGLLAPGSDRVVRFDPSDGAPRAETFADGLTDVNGLAVDAEGNLYVGRHFSTNILKVRADGTVDEQWTKAADVFGTNGVEIVGDQLYASVIIDLRASVVRVPLDEPSAHEKVAELGPGPLDLKVLDDLVGFDGDLVVTAFLSGELIRLDPATGESCTLTDRVLMPTSVRTPEGFGGHDPARQLFVTEASGRILKVTVG